MTYQDPYSGGGSNAPQNPQPPQWQTASSAPDAYSAPQFGGGQPYQGGPAYGQPPRKKKGLKRIIFGSLGIVANILGLLVMPFIAAVIVAAVSVGTASLTPLDTDGGTFQANSMSLYMVSVPAEDLATASCEITGSDVSVDTDTTGTDLGEIDGVTYVHAYDVSATGDQEVTVQCTGTDSVAVSEIGTGGTLIGFGVGFVIPLGLGLIALIMLIWGIIARVRS